VNYSSQRSAWLWVLPLALPCIALFFVPAFDSPFIAAKTSFLLGIGALAAFAGMAGVFPKKFSKIFPEKLLLWSAIFWASVVLFSTLHTGNWAECWRPIALFIAVALLLIAYVRQKISEKTIVTAIAVSGFSVAIFAISGHFGYDLPRFFAGMAAPGRMRTASTLGNPLFVASFLSVSIWAAFILPWRFSRIPLALIVLAGMLVTTERTAMLAFVAGTLCFSVCGVKTQRQRVLLLTIALILIVLPLGVFRNPRSLKTTVQGRIFLWKTALQHITFFGNGPGSFYRMYNRDLRELAPEIPASEFHFIDYETASYNICVQAVVETGILGLIAMLIFFAAWFRMAWKLRENQTAACAMAAVAAFLAAGLADDPLSRPEGMVLLAAWLAVPILILFRDNPESFRLESSRLGLRSASFVIASTISLLLLFAGAVTAFSSYAVHAGEMAEDRGDWAQAERWDRTVLRFDPAERDARYNLVRVLAQEENYQASFAESEKALQWVNEAELHIIRIRILPMLGKRQQAQDELVRAQKEFPWSQELQQETVANTN
jgi:O-antigen ligase